MASTVVTGANYVMDVFDDPYNKRIRIDDIKGSFSEAIAKAEELAVNSGAEKLIVKGRKEQFVQLLENGYQCEAMIDRFFSWFRLLFLL